MENSLLKLNQGNEKKRHRLVSAVKIGFRWQQINIFDHFRSKETVESVIGES